MESRSGRPLLYIMNYLPSKLCSNIFWHYRSSPNKLFLLELANTVSSMYLLHRVLKQTQLQQHKKYIKILQQVFLDALVSSIIYEISPILLDNNSIFIKFSASYLKFGKRVPPSKVLMNHFWEEVNSFPPSWFLVEYLGPFPIILVPEYVWYNVIHSKNCHIEDGTACEFCWFTPTPGSVSSNLIYLRSFLISFNASVHC